MMSVIITAVFISDKSPSSPLSLIFYRCRLRLLRIARPALGISPYLASGYVTFFAEISPKIPCKTPSAQTTGGRLPNVRNVGRGHKSIGCPKKPLRFPQALARLSLLPGTFPRTSCFALVNLLGEAVGSAPPSGERIVASVCLLPVARLTPTALGAPPSR